MSGSHLILTHEQADFDAVAAALAAHLLHPGSIPVLPRRLNRNVRAFLNLYSDRLPFVEHEDLPGGKVERVTLVDTQSLLSVKGVTQRTEVYVIDHHPPQPGLPAHWQVHCEEVGATTTLLVEVLREANGGLDLAQATLLLLGIYEDTGSLTYAGTTPRDVYAAAWLLEQGASLVVAADFLNHPLSPEQRQLYEHLLEAAETHEIHGLTVMIATAEARGLTDEISSIAHKLRDVFDPDGLFVLVALDGHVQLVARSTQDAIDVSRVAAHFGGGGHDRAAAALIRDRSLEEVHQELLALLPQVIQPPRTVAEIMSRDPEVLDASTSIAEAAERMQRFGHEGYPVVREGRVVGLLTRRAVDRAMLHGLSAEPVERIMEAGEVYVHLNDSIQHLQRVMVQHGWGQVPVVDPEAGAVVGIVTRTDVLNTLAAGVVGRRPPNLGDRLEAALPPARLRLLRLIGRSAERRGDALYVVGGFVRDLLLGTPSVDFDLVVEGDAIGLARSLARRYGGRVSSHRRFGAAKWRLDLGNQALRQAIGLQGAPAADNLPETLDFVTARTEFYPHPTALPSVRRGSIKLDLHRRDFTINTLAVRLDGPHYGELLDFWGGGEDLKRRLIRVLHSLSFVDDPTRMLRAVRLEQRLGFQVEDRTLELLLQARPLLRRVSGDRVRDELELIFEEKRLTAIMARLHELGLLREIHPALTWDGWLEARFEAARAWSPPAEWGVDAPPVSLRLMALWVFRRRAEEVLALSERLRLKVRERQVLLGTHRVGHTLPDMTEAPPSRVVTLLEEVPLEAVVIAWLVLPEDGRSRRLIEAFLTHWRHLAPHATGHTLRGMGLPPGPLYGRILRRLRAAWLDGQVGTPGEERRLLEQLVEEARQRV